MNSGRHAILHGVGSVCTVLAPSNRRAPHNAVLLRSASSTAAVQLCTPLCSCGEPAEDAVELEVRSALCSGVTFSPLSMVLARLFTNRSLKPATRQTAI